ncbi:ALG3 protein [Rhizoctonia solani]|uniref:Dol-P-Man:Man(5)GlcNAc(2)-PP-Dol alpha-1,3-mannosyltransferase n=1 Tax=Rhizoctonia solani TaxID=456999 RepID=A0A8H7HI96_9AGAM|nr:ALG3 protein [Rhizoctonia solani]
MPGYTCSPWLLHFSSTGAQEFHNTSYFYSPLANGSTPSTSFDYSTTAGPHLFPWVPFTPFKNDTGRSVAYSSGVSFHLITLSQRPTFQNSLAISIKMNVLLYMPAACLVLLLTNGLIPSLLYLSLTFLAVLIPSLPFLETYPMEYLVNAFDLSRQFLYKWTVNWRFVPEHTFLSAPFAKGLLLCHIILLGTFGFGAWCKKQGGAWSVLERALQNPARETAIASVSQDYIATVFFTANLIGILCARSLHYQFYSWYATQLPLLAWRTKYPIALRIMILGIIEYAWNTYPSTDLSSGLLLAAHVLLLIGVLFGYPEGTNTSIVRWDDEIEVEKLD